jgi:hypothetical protein
MNQDGTSDGESQIAPAALQTGVNQPSVDVFPDGSFIAAWSVNAPVAAGPEIVARLFNADGTPRGEAFAVNTTTDGYDIRPSVAAMDDGSFFIAWRHQMVAGDDIRGRLFSADGTAAGPDFLAVTTPNITQMNPDRGGLERRGRGHRPGDEPRRQLGHG